MRSSCRLATLLFSPLLLWLPASIAADALWLREPALSPDGKQLAFTWQGRIFVASAEGGPATALTGSDYLSQRPIWSPDGKQLAFAANLYGNEDVFVVPASGGEMVRLTRDSRTDLPQAFSADGKRLLLSSQRLGTRCRPFCRGRLPMGRALLDPDQRRHLAGRSAAACDPGPSPRRAARLPDARGGSTLSQASALVRGAPSLAV